MENIGICLPGGGALCSAQAGELKALYEWMSAKGIRPKAVRGASGGDLNASIFVQAFADGGESITTMEEMWKTISHRKVHTLIPHIYPRSTGLFKLTPLTRMLRNVISPDKLLQSGIDYSVRASRYGAESDIEVKPSDPSFFEMLTASASYPGAFKPVKIWGYYWADSGMTNNVPINRCIQAGCTTIFVVRPYPNSSPKKVNMRMLYLMGHVLGELMHSQLDAQIAEVNYINQLVAAGFMTNKRKITLIEIMPEKESGLGVIDFNARKCSRAFDDGYRSARKYLVNVAVDSPKTG